MRKIKFRAWDIKSKKYRGLGNVQDLFTIRSDGHVNEDYILEQFTGLKDRNGNEIYDGSVVKYKSSTKYGSDNERLSYVGEIQYWVGQMGIGFRYKSGNHTMMLKTGHGFNMEIIGNIHENPELLNQKQ